MKEQVLLGVTGSGKTFTMANVIARVNKPTLVLAHNKTLAASSARSSASFSRKTRVEYFVSYYDYYQPEAYHRRRPIPISKRTRPSTTRWSAAPCATVAHPERRDVIIVASVAASTVWAIRTSTQTCSSLVRRGISSTARTLMRRLRIRYERNDMELSRGTFRVRGDAMEIPLGHDRRLYRDRDVRR